MISSKRPALLGLILLTSLLTFYAQDKVPDAPISASAPVAAPSTASQDHRPDITKQLPPIKKEQVKSYGCLIKPVVKRIGIYNAKTKEVTYQEAFREYELTLRMLDTKGEVIWKFEPAPYATKRAAYDDCDRWEVEMDKNYSGGKK